LVVIPTRHGSEPILLGVGRQIELVPTLQNFFVFFTDGGAVEHAIVFAIGKFLGSLNI
jgi:hypothetical protein